jgi:hypothetical protein
MQHDRLDQGETGWAKAPRLIRFTPGTTAPVNGYWMCDIGRFEHHWIRRRAHPRPLEERDGQGLTQHATFGTI